MARGLFIVFEGTEKGGKKTQAKLLADALTQISGKETLLVHFPDLSTNIGHLLADYHEGRINLENHVAHLLYTANSWERQKDIEMALNCGVHVVVDRYSSSNIVSTAAKINPLSQADWSWCRTTESGLIPPDVIFCLAPEDIREISTRDGFGEHRFETVPFQEKILGYYARLSSELELEETGSCETNGDDNRGKRWHWIQATGQTVEDVHSCIMTIIEPLL